MYEYSLPWTVSSPNGTFQLNDGSSGAVLTEIDGFGSPAIRPAIEEWAADDGGSAADGFYGPRTVTLRGKIGVKQTAAQRNAAMVAFQKVLSGGLRTDITLTTTPTGMTAKYVVGRLQEGLQFSGGELKDWQFQVICADHVIH